MARESVARLPGPVRWIGGKGKTASKLLPLVPYGVVYCEPYGGAASMLFGRRRSRSEVYNDLNGDLVNLFRAFQDPRRFRRLRRRLRSTLYSLEEFKLAVGVLNTPDANPDDRAWAMFVGQNQVFSGLNAKKMTGGSWGRSLGGAVISWPSQLRKLDLWRDRLLGVQIDCRQAFEVLEYWDTEDTVFYVDPPYAQDARTSDSDYEHEADDDHHGQLVGILLARKGGVALSGYETPMYDPLVEAGWRCDRFKITCNAAARTRQSGLQGVGVVTEKQGRTECLWRNPRAVAMLRSPVQTSLVDTEDGW